MLADQGSAGRPQAGDAEVVQRISRQSQIVSVHAVILGFTQVHPLQEAIRTQNLVVKNSGEYNWGAGSGFCKACRFGNLNYNARLFLRRNFQVRPE